MELLVLARSLSGHGGHERSLFDTCSGLVARGHRIHLAYTSPGDLSDAYKHICLSMKPLDGYELGSLRNLVNIPQWLASVLRTRAVPCDAVYINQYADVFFGAAVARLKRRPLVCHLRLPPPVRPCGQWRLGLPAVTRFIANSHHTRGLYMEAGYSEYTIGVVHNGVDISVFAPAHTWDMDRQRLNIPRNAFVVLYAGRFVRSKNIEMIMRAFASLELDASRARLLLVGGPTDTGSHRVEGRAYMKEMEDLAATLGISDAIHWLGWQRDMAKLYQLADVTVLVSVRDNETFGRTLIESMACGTPAIGTAVGGMSEVLTGSFSRFLIPDGDLRALVEAMKGLIGWKSKEENLGRRCRDHVESLFSLGNMAEGVERELNHALALGPRRLGPRF